MLKPARVFLVLTLVAISAASPAVLATVFPQELTKTEEEEARNLAAQFVVQFAESKDLAPVVERQSRP